MSITDSVVLSGARDWLGRPQLQSAPKSSTEVTWLGGEDDAAGAIQLARVLRPLMSGRGERAAKLKSEIRLGWTAGALWVRATLLTPRLDRVEKLGPGAYRRDKWGADALEVQIDMGHTKVRYAHLIFTPCGQLVSYEGFSNRHVDGYHPEVRLKVGVDPEAGAWVVEARIGFDALGETPRTGDVWGLNIVRVDADEEGGYSQWAPTFGEALRPSLFGGMKFLGVGESGLCDGGHGEAEIAAYGNYWRAKREAFERQINGVGEGDALAQLRVGKELEQGALRDWKAWGEHLAKRAHPGPVRWDSWEAGKVPECDHGTVMALVGKAMEKVQGWDVNRPTVEYLDIIQMEPLADALTLTGDVVYAKAIEKAILAHDACWRAIIEKPGAPVGHEHPRLYPDSQVTQAVFLGHLYFALVRHGNVDERVHAAVMLRMMRAGRFADQNISQVYFYGNHQAHESAGLGTIASLFPEFEESDRWAQTASLAMRMHYLSDVYSDGGYMERCGYHAVALSFTAQTIAAIKTSGQEARYSSFICDEVMEVIDRMYGWVVKMTLPDATLPPFGDFRKHSQARLLLQGAMLRGRRDWLGPVKRAVPGLLEGLEFKEMGDEGSASVSMAESGFTVMRSAAGGHAMAVDHGPLGGQHSHVDTMGFVAYAGGRAVAVDSGMGMTYSDPNYLAWYRTAEAHNIVTVDDAVPEKAARRTGWHGGKSGDILVMRSDAWRYSRGVAWERAILFSHVGAWVVFDRLWRVDESVTKPGFYDLHLHCPLQLEPGADGRAKSKAGADVVFAVVGAEKIVGPTIGSKPGTSGPPETLPLRLHDAMWLWGHAMVEEVSHATWRVAADKNGGAWFTTVILADKDAQLMMVGQRNAVIHMAGARVEFARDGGGWTILTRRAAGAQQVERLDAVLE